jgi:hypothetical protein
MYTCRYMYMQDVTLYVAVRFLIVTLLPVIFLQSNSVCWVGKGIVYDTGGLSIKSKESMPTMKRDMCGAAGIGQHLLYSADFSLWVKANLQDSVIDVVHSFYVQYRVHVLQVPSIIPNAS